ncbi:hypothetical protein N665_3248s0003 [Sinapis alba]|nr:hypothetical protein N665_3248s0003 [Sinapis alba]
MEEKEIGSVWVAITGTTRSDHSATDASSLVFSWITIPLTTLSGFLVSVIGSALCKKCGQPKEVAALSALAIPGAASLQTHLSYLTRGPDPVDQLGSLLPFSNPVNQASALKEWRSGDWICVCGFHNYSSRIQCKKCNETAPLALGTKRLASEVLAHEWDSKRLNQGYTSMQPQSSLYASFPGISSGSISNWQLPLPFLQQQLTPALLGKGAKQWRDGDWMCTNCKNHNYASRSECNRCKNKRDIIEQAVRP